MNWYEEMARELINAGMTTGCKITDIPDDLKPTKEDFAELERKISIRIEENIKRKFLSEIYTKENLSYGKKKSLGKKHTK